MKSTARYLAAAAVLALVVAGTAWGTARITDANTLYACAQKSEGMLRLVDASTACRDSETPVEWSIVGPQGPQGNPGPPGPAGGVSAYARVRADGTLDEASSSGVIAVTRTTLPGSLVPPSTCCAIPVTCFDLAARAAVAVATSDVKVMPAQPPPLPGFPAMSAGVLLLAPSVALAPAQIAEVGCGPGTDVAIVTSGAASVAFSAIFM